MPDYEIKEWNEENFDVNACAFTREAYAMRDYAFVSDVCRLKALYEQGGIYLDTDVEAVRPFDAFLHHSSFCGYEAHEYIGTGVIGAEKGCRWIGMFWELYKRRHFINAFGHAVRTANVKLLTRELMPKVPLKDRPELFAIDYFCAKNWDTKKIVVTEHTVCIHHYACSWKRKKKTLLVRMRLLARGCCVRYLMKEVKR